MELTFFDVETPNRHHDRVCSIAAIKSDLSGKTIDSIEVLVNPETSYDPFNTKIHGIDAAMTKEKPNLLDSWNRLERFFSVDILVAHNANFDLNVLNKALSFYDIKRRETHYICTLNAAKSLYSLESYSLPELCKEFGIPLYNHHKAIDDTEACKSLFFTMYETGGLSEKNIVSYVPKDYSAPTPKPGDSFSTAMSDLYGIALGINIDSTVWDDETNGLTEWKERNKASTSLPYFKEAFNVIDRVLEDSSISDYEIELLLNISRPFLDTRPEKREAQATRELIGILRGIMCDDWLNDREINGLKKWLDDQPRSADKTMQLVISAVNNVLQDGIITEDEGDYLFSLFDSIINPVSEEEGLSLQNKKFVLSGDFSSGSKTDIKEQVEKSGGIVVSSVSKKVDYVVVGSLGSDAYSFGNYGTKVKKAMELQAEGVPISIIEEATLMDALNNLSSAQVSA